MERRAEAAVRGTGGVATTGTLLDDAEGYRQAPVGIREACPRLVAARARLPPRLGQIRIEVDHLSE